MLIKSIITLLFFISFCFTISAQGYMSSPGFTGKHAQYKFSQNTFYHVNELGAGLTYAGRVSVNWGFGYSTYESGLTGFSFSQRLSFFVLKQSSKMPISLGLNIDVQKSLVESAIQGEDFPISHFSLSLHYAYRSIERMQFIPSFEFGARRDPAFIDDVYTLQGDYFTALSMTLGYTYFYVEPKMIFHTEQKFFQLSLGVFIP